MPLFGGAKALLLRSHRPIDLLLRLLQRLLRLLELLLPCRGAGGGCSHCFDAAAGDCREGEQRKDPYDVHGVVSPMLLITTRRCPVWWKNFSSARFYFDRLSITRFALPIERSMVLRGTFLTSALMPMYDLIACCSPWAPSPSTSTVRWSSGPCLESSRT